MDKCIRCEGATEKGFLVDRGDVDVTGQAQWASGEPAPSFWRGSSVQGSDRVLPVVTYRCTKCGRLESFAPESS